MRQPFDSHFTSQGYTLINMLIINKVSRGTPPRPHGPGQPRVRESKPRRDFSRREAPARKRCKSVSSCAGSWLLTIAVCRRKVVDKCDLVGGFNLPLWKMMEFVSWDYELPNMESHHPNGPNHQPGMTVNDRPGSPLPYRKHRKKIWRTD